MNHQIALGVSNCTNDQVFKIFKKDMLNDIHENEYMDFYDITMFYGVYEDVYQNYATPENKNFWKWFLKNN